MPTPVSSITTYATLQQAVADYLIRDDLTTQIQLWISNAETEFNRKIRNRQMEVKFSTSTIVAQSDYVLPTDYLEVRKLRIIDSCAVPLSYVTPQQIDVLFSSTTQDRPLIYTIYGQALTLAPPPGGVYVLDLWYYQKLPALSLTNTSNWLLAAHPDLYLYGTLLQAEPYLVDDGQLQKYAAVYGQIMDSLKEEEMEEEWNGSSLSANADFYTP